MYKTLKKMTAIVLIIPILCYSFMVCDVKVVDAESASEPTYKNSFVFSQNSIPRNRKKENYIVFSENEKNMTMLSLNFRLLILLVKTARA